MRKFFKIIVSVLALVVITVGAVLLYWGRDQEIDFSKILPKELEYCGYAIDQGSPEYVELMVWFKMNQHGWRNTLVTYVPTSMYTAPNISVNVMNGGVVVNYQNKTGSWVQVVKQKKASELANKCKKVNNVLNSDAAKSAAPVS